MDVNGFLLMPAVTWHEENFMLRMLGARLCLHAI